MSKRNWFSMQGAADGSGDITILSDIGGWGISAQSFYDELKALGNLSELRIRISSNGGDVPTGFAIYNMLNRHQANKVVTIDGLAASMASIVAMAGDQIVMPANAMMMIHNPCGSIQGDGDTVSSFADALKVMQTNMAQAYKDRSGLPLGQIRKMMDAETWLSAKSAVEMGFADNIEKPTDTRGMVIPNSFARIPPKFAARIQRTVPTPKGKTMKQQNAEAEFEAESAETTPTKEEIRKELLAYQTEVRSVCALAGRKPEEAEAYIAADKSLADVIKDLETKREADAKAAAEKAAKGKKGANAGTEVSAHNNPARESSGSDSADVNPATVYGHWNSAGKRRK